MKLAQLFVIVTALVLLAGCLSANAGADPPPTPTPTVSVSEPPPSPTAVPRPIEKADGANAAPDARQAACNTTSWTWPLCHVGRPSIPRYNMGGPRPALTPKDSAWCQSKWIVTSQDGTVGWYLYNVTKHDLNLWPDYSTRVYAICYWNGTEWLHPFGLGWESVHCDA